jgi:hypothetical protein
MMDRTTRPGITNYFLGRDPGSWLQLQISGDVTNSQTEDSHSEPATDAEGKPLYLFEVPVTVLQVSAPGWDGSERVVYLNEYERGGKAPHPATRMAKAVKAAMEAAGIPDPRKALLDGKLGGAVLLVQSAGDSYTVQYTPKMS